MPIRAFILLLVGCSLAAGVACSGGADAPPPRATGAIAPTAPAPATVTVAPAPQPPGPTPAPPTAVPPPAAPPSATAAAPAPAAGATRTATIAMSGLSFDRAVITVAGGGTITVSVSNRDAGIAHNFVVYADRSAARSIGGADAGNCVGPCSYTVSFGAPPPGSYFFRCDFHPVDMSGTFVVQ